MDAIERLLAVEAIRKTKGTYWYALDMKDWDRFASVFTEDALVDMREEVAFGAGQTLTGMVPAEEALAAGDPAVSRGSKAFAAMISVALRSWKTVHHGHEPIIDIDSPDEGRAIWPLFDYIDDGTRALMGYGHYHETYRRQPNGAWLISSMRLTRLRADGDYPRLGT